MSGLTWDDRSVVRTNTFHTENPYAAPEAPLGVALPHRDIFRPRRWHLLASSLTLGIIGTMALVGGLVALRRLPAAQGGFWIAGLGALFLYLAAIVGYQWRARRWPVVRPCREGVLVRLVGISATDRPADWRALFGGGAFRVQTYRIPWDGFLETRVIVRALSPTLLVVGVPEGSAQPAAFHFVDAEFSAPPALAAAELARLSIAPGDRGDLPGWGDLD
jgi:hypothetical protein